MRILFLVHQFMPDFAAGTERVTLNLAKAAQSEGHHVEVLTVSQAGGIGWTPAEGGLLEATVEGVPVTAIPSRERPLVDLGFVPNPELAAATAKFLKVRPEFDVAHVTHALRMAEAVEALAALRIPYVVTVTDFFAICHRLGLTRVSGAPCEGPRGGANCRKFCHAPELADRAYADRLERFHGVLRKSSAVVAVSDFVAQRLKAEHPNLAVRVVPNGVNLLAFRPKPSRKAGPLTIGYLGTVSRVKGAVMLARAFAAASAPGVRLRLVGPVGEPEVAAEIEALAKRAAITLEGPVPAERAPEVLAGFDVLAVPTQVPETFSLSLHEGFAAGLPALVTDLGNPGQVVRSSGAGLALPVDEAAWAAAIADLAATPHRLADWAAALPLPWRVEEEAFLYSQIYRAIIPTAAVQSA